MRWERGGASVWRPHRSLSTHAPPSTDPLHPQEAELLDEVRTLTQRADDLEATASGPAAAAVGFGPSSPRALPLSPTASAAGDFGGPTPPRSPAAPVPLGAGARHHGRRGGHNAAVAPAGAAVAGSR